MKKKGFTLIELLVVLSIMGFIATALYYVLNAGIEGWRAGKERTDIIAQARVAMDRLTREVREATWMASADTTSINFSAYVGETSPKDISYYYDSSEDILYRNNITDETGTQMMAKYMDSFILTYYSKNMTELSSPVDTPADIWMITIDAQITRGPTGEQNVVNLRSTVQPRNHPYPQ